MSPRQIVSRAVAAACACSGAPAVSDAAVGYAWTVAGSAALAALKAGDDLRAAEFLEAAHEIQTWIEAESIKLDPEKHAADAAAVLEKFFKG